MPKALEDHEARLTSASPTQDNGDVFENQPLRILSHDSHSDKVESFTTLHNLQDQLSIFQKASELLQSDHPEDVLSLTPEESSALRREITNKWAQPRLLYFTILICSLGAVEQGWAQTSMNGANLSFPSALHIGSTSSHDVFVVGLINSGLYLSVGLWGAWISEPLNNRLGRRGAIFVGSGLCLLGNLGSAFSFTWPVLLFFRLLLGTGLGVNASTVSVFAAEASPSYIRGGVSVSWQMWVAFGIFLGFVANVAVYNHGSSTWRLQLAAPFIPVVPLLFMIRFCPESPAWYIKRGRYDLAYRSLTQLRNTEIQAAKELYHSYLQQQARSESHVQASSYFSRLIELFSVPRIRHATIASYTVVLSQQLCGINIIAFYSSTIFSDAGFSTFGALIASCVFGFVNFVGAFPAVWTMDTLGRRSLLLWTLPFMAFTMLLTGLSFRLPEGNLQFGSLALLIYLFCAEYSPGMGPVPSAYSAEVFPLSHREVGMSMSVATGNSWAAILSLTFPSLLTGLGSEGAFELYAFLNVVAVVLVFLFVRETKKKTLDELDEVFAIDLGTFVRFKVRKRLPWLWRSYITKAKDVEDEPMLGNSGYREVGQDEEAD